MHRTDLLLSTLLVVGGLVFPPHATHAQFTQQGDKLVGTGGVGEPLQGRSVALSSDGNTAIVGGFQDNILFGAAWVFTRTGGVWSQQGGKLVGSGAVGNLIQQGMSVSLSSDGNTAIIGGNWDNSYAGAAWVFTRTGGVWSQQGNKLVGTGAVGAAQQGWSVSLSADGNTAIVGGANDSSEAGAAWVFIRTNGAWTQQGSKLVGTGALGTFVHQGTSVSLSADGNTALVGGPGDGGAGSDTGAAWVYTRTGGVWSQQGGKLVGTGAAGTNVQQGLSVALSADGNSAIVGGLGDSGSFGAAWVYTRTGGVWSQQGDKLVGTGAMGAASQGASVSISSDGNTAIVGGLGDNNTAGAAWVYTRTGGVWSQLGNKVVGTGAVGPAAQGYVALSADGNTAIVGGFGDNRFVGAAWVYVRGVSAVGEPGGIIPYRFGLAQNYPNPFNPSTSLQLSIGNRELATVKVYDILGQVVATLLNEVKEPGIYTLQFTAKGLASGVYFSRLQAGSFIETRRLLLLR